MQSLKKRLPLLIVISSALMMFVLIKAFGPTETNTEKDQDKDGFEDNLDKCPELPSQSNGGCPEKTINTINKQDQDNDGYFNIELGTGKNPDPDDKNACIPDKTCASCDEDGDKLTRQEEIALKSDFNTSDTDGDGISDKQDKCPSIPGVAKEQGCQQTISVDFSAQGRQLSWNPELTEHIRNITIELTNLSDGTTNILNPDPQTYTFGIEKRYIKYSGLEWSIKINIQLKNSNTIKLTGRTSIGKITL